MVIHYPSGRQRRDGDRPTAVIGMLVAASASSYRTGEILLGTPTCSARSRHGLWALYPNGDGVIVVWPGGAVAGPPVQVATELDSLGDGGHDDLDRAAARTIRQFLTDPAVTGSARWLATRQRTWSNPAVGYWLSGATNQASGRDLPSTWPGAPARPPHPPITLPDPHPKPEPARAA
jgi:hypothetical protein